MSDDDTTQPAAADEHEEHTPVHGYDDDVSELTVDDPAVTGEIDED